MFAHQRATSKDGTITKDTTSTRPRPLLRSTSYEGRNHEGSTRLEDELPSKWRSTSKSRNDVGVQVESHDHVQIVERHEKSTETDNSLELISPQTWSSPLDVTLSVDTGSTNTNRGSPIRRRHLGDNGQGILAVAINPGDIGIPIIDTRAVRSKLPSPGKGRHVTFSSFAEDDRERVAEQRNASQRFPRSFSYAPDVNFASVRKKQVTNDFESKESEEERFVDGDYFFNHLIPQREAEEYRANLLRYQRRNADDFVAFGHGRRRRPVPADDYADRLSTSLPADYFLPQRGYYYYEDKRPPTRNGSHLGRGRGATQEMPFAGGMELEIPLRRHAGLGGGGLRQSISADRLLVAPRRSQQDRTSQFGRRFFRSGSAVINDGASNENGSGNQLWSNKFENGSRSTSISRDVDVVDNAKDVLSNPLTYYGNQSQNQSFNRERGANLVSLNRFEQVPSNRLEQTNEHPAYRIQSGSSFQSSLPLIEYDTNRSPNHGSSSLHPNPVRVSHPHPTDGSRLTGFEERIRDSHDPISFDRERRSRFLSQTWNEVGIGSTSPRFHRQENERLSMSWDQSRFRTALQHSHPHLATSSNAFARSAVDLNRSLQLPLHVVHSHPHHHHPENGLRTTNRKVVSWQDPEVSNPVIVSDSRELVRAPSSEDFESELRTETEENKELQNEMNISSKLSGSPSRSFEMSDLDNIDQFALFEVSTSSLGWGQSFMGTSWIDSINQYKFVVLNRYEEVLFFGIEESGSISNGLMGPHKSSFKVRILNANGEDVIQFQRLYPVKSGSKFTLGKKQKYRLEVSTSSGHIIGNVEKTYDSDTYYVLEDRAGECLFVIQKSCICTCPLFWDYEFKVLVPGTDTDIGDISWSYLTAQEERFNGTEISFPVELDTKSKLMLLGVCFLLNFSRWPSRYLESVYNPRKRSQRTKPKNATVASNVDAANNNQRKGNVAVNRS